MRKNFFSKDYYNIHLFETENFVVVPSLGSIVEGWLLIVPKKDHINFSLIDSGLGPELSQLLDLVKSKLRKAYKTEVVVFEHGPIATNCQVGCGVDYAHLHVVPTKFDLLSGVKRFVGLDFEWQRIAGLHKLIGNPNQESSYIYLQHQNSESFLALSDQIPSQLIRKVIASYLGQADRYDWKKFPEYEKIDKTVERILKSVAA